MAKAAKTKRKVRGTRVLRDGTYEVILVVPADCVERLGKKNLTQRLNTSSYQRASDLAPPILRKFQAIVAATRAGQSDQVSPVGPVDARKAVRAIEDWRIAELGLAEQRAFNVPDPVIPDRNSHFEDHVRFKANHFELRDALRRPERWVAIPDFDTRLIEAIRQGGVVLDATHPAMDRLRPTFQAAWRDVVQYEDDLRAGTAAPGEWPTPPSDFAPAQSLPTRAHDTPTIMQTFAHWKTEHIKAKGAEKTVGEFETQLRRFVEVVGDKPVAEVTKRDVVAFKDVMMNYPSRCPSELTGKGVKHIAGWAEQSKARMLSPKTLNEKVLASLRAVFACAVQRGDIDTNPAHGVRVKASSTGADVKPRSPYTHDELEALFGCPVFTTGERPKGGAGEAAKWIPLLALMTGARLEEIAIIETPDIKEEAGVAFIHFKTLNDDGSPRRVKNRFVRRKVPIHTKLIELGFLKFVDRQRKARILRLFPGVISKRNQNSAAFSQWYGRYARKYVPDTSKTFHSFRHTFKRELRNAKIEKALRDSVMGHVHQDIGETYGVDEDGQGFDVSVLQQAVEAVVYRSVQFDRIR